MKIDALTPYYSPLARPKTPTTAVQAVGDVFEPNPENPEGRRRNLKQDWQKYLGAEEQTPTVTPEKLKRSTALTRHAFNASGGEAPLLVYNDKGAWVRAVLDAPLIAKA